VLVSAAVVLAVSALGFGVDSVFLAGPVQAAGVVAPVAAAQLDFGVSGPVTQIDVRPGQVVQAGTVLASEDTSALNATLTAAEAKLNADSADAQQNAQLGAPAQAQQLQAQVNQAQTQLAAAKAKAFDVTNTDNAAVTAAQTQVQSAQATLGTDQMWAGAACTTTCATQARQLAVDQGALNSAQASYQQALATRSADIDGANAQVAVAAAALTSAQAGQAVGLLPSSTAGAHAQATIAADEAAIASAKVQLSQAVLTAPFTGVVASVNGVVGDYATPQGIKPLSSPSPLPQQPSSGIAIFPQSPQAQVQAQPQLTSMITLDSPQSQIITQVPETQIETVHVGGGAQVSLPAMPGQRFTATVRQIQPTAVYVSGQAYFLVDLVVSANQSRTDTGGHAIVEKLVDDVVNTASTGNQGTTGPQSTTIAGPLGHIELTGLSADVSF
jgi:multidrug efflux pump subunit AcrA (membrane-fusion protein)